MFKKLKSSNEGFTIIEVLIVLAIAALILLIVFLAVPALQRNSRNTQRKNDVASILSGMNEFATNNNGSLPTFFQGTNAITWNLKNGTAGTTAESKVGYYQGGLGTANGDVSINTTAPATAGPIANPADGTHDYVLVYIGETCDPSAAVPGSVKAAGSRALAVQYEIETGSGSWGAVCQSS